MLCVVGDDAPVEVSVVLYVRVDLQSHESSILFLFLLFFQHRAEIQRSSSSNGSSMCLTEISRAPCWRSTPVVLLLETHRLSISGQEKFSPGKSTCRDLREAGQRVDRVVVAHSHRVDKKLGKVGGR